MGAHRLAAIAGADAILKANSLDELDALGLAEAGAPAAEAQGGAKRQKAAAGDATAAEPIAPRAGPPISAVAAVADATKAAAAEVPTATEAAQANEATAQVDAASAKAAAAFGAY